MNLKNCLLIRRIIVVTFLFSLFYSNVFCQDNFVAIPDSVAAQYHIDFAHNFFATPEAEKADRVNLNNLLEALEKLKGKVTVSSGNLLQALQLNDKLQILFNRHYSYLYLRYAVNTKGETGSMEAAALEAEINKRTAFLNQELIQITDRKFAIFARQEPELANYLFVIESVRRYRPYSLSLKEEELLSITEPLNSEWQYDLYEKLMPHNQVTFPVNNAGDGAAVAAANPATSVSIDAERAKREAKFKKFFAGFASQRDLYAFTLMRLASSRTQLAKLQHFKDAASQSYFDRYWTKAEVSSLLEQIAKQAGIYKRYEQIRSNYVKKITGYSDVNIWDLELTSKNIKVPRFTIEQATEVIEKALAPLGSEYGRELAHLLDPANGRMDIVPGKNRKSGGFSRGYIGTDSVFFSGGFKGFYNDVRVLTHESTHAIHRQLMNGNKILPAYASGPHYLFEAFAILNEFLLPAYLYDNETDPALKRYYLEQFLEGKGMEMITVAPEAMLEEAVYEGVENGSVKEADDLDALTKRIYSRFSIFPVKHDEMKNQWMDVKLMFQDPFYDVNYVYGVLLALKFYEMYKRDPQYFVPRYIDLLKNGFNAPPEVLLKRFLDIDIHDPQLLTDDLKILEEKVNLLEKSYQE